MNLQEHKFSNMQKEILSLLLRRYENSATYKDKNKVNQSFSCKPEEVFPDYHADTTDIQEIEAFEREVSELENAGCIRIIKAQGEIQKITLCPEAIVQCRGALGHEDKQSILKRSEEILLWYCNTSELLQNICDAQIERLKQYKLQNLTKQDADLEDALRCIAAIERNDAECMEREFSIAMFGNSKRFEKRFKSVVCTQLLCYSPYGEEIRKNVHKKHQNHAILSCYQIEQNPSYIYLKGDGEIVLEDGTHMQLSALYPIALSSDTVKCIQTITIKCDTVMIIENLTSYHRMPCDGRFLVFLNGYHNHIKTLFLNKIASDNKVFHWLHFGDIDPDGFHVLLNLIDKTMLPFRPAYMSLEELNTYSEYWNDLTAHDRTVAEKLIRNQQYTEIMTFCLEYNCKLE